ncbi:P-loop containing nucleoside triphosphate hydrolase protein [Neocallimastix californiae]|uniref:p-loop containing nucleoside triphosphate hydrolase protein n=1 Tax=Neocallimastix californiae TaxID=1754190 RepID=A0A1Y2EQQ4_9FUNG|nr:P-loop containing nucleoside triphosphate hydrolase protein [Neocallimastix californiae]|eukprot:ORY73165.1 P-loop containing nucleoside triphosphate hydrolase protein [Neocallimastix californiae]
MRGNYPPNLRMEDLESIPDVFESALQYRKIFEKLLLVECWSQFVQAVEELNVKNDSFPVYIDNVELKEFNKERRDTSMDEYEILLTGSSKHCEGKFLTNDVLVLYQGDNMYSLEDSILVRVLETPSQSFFQSNKINSGFTKEHDVSFKCSGFLPINSRFFMANTSWRCIKLFTLITLRREFLVMELIIKSNLRKSIFNPTIEKINDLREDYIQKVMNDYELNQSQAEAVDLVMQKNNGFSLIQGPPGTGKTKTVLVLINEILKKLAYSESSPKILVCTPSNAACDEIARRLKIGIKAGDKLVKLPILRYGISDISEDCKDLSLDVLATDNLIDYIANEKMVLSYHNEELTSLAKNLVYFQRKMATIMDDLNVEYEIFIKTGKIDQDSVNFLTNEMRLAENRKMSYLRDYIQCLRSLDSNINLSKLIINSKYKVFEQVNVVLTTLSISTQSALTDYWDTYSTVIIDEAGQASELTTLIPMQHHIKHAVLIGDPNQLPPTIISKVAQNYLYEQSLFKRIQNCRPELVKMLNVQYRMHPMVSQFPRQYFYENKLLDHESMLAKNTRPWHQDPQGRFPPFLFFDVKGQERLNRERGISLVNEAEVGAIAQIIRSLCFSYPDIIFAYKLGIVTPYRGQVRKLRSHFVRLFGRTILKYIEINTVDSFQGQEKDIIFFSCVRSSNNNSNSRQDHGIGFLADVRRMNVAITRARSSLYVLGDTQTLLSNSSWASLIQYAREVKSIRKYKWYQYQTDPKAIPVNIYPSQNEMALAFDTNHPFHKKFGNNRLNQANLMGPRSFSQNQSQSQNQNKILGQGQIPNNLLMSQRSHSQNSLLGQRANSYNSIQSQDSESTLDSEEQETSISNINTNASNTQNKYYKKYAFGIDKDLLLKDYLKENSGGSEKEAFPKLGSTSSTSLKNLTKDDFPSLGSSSNNNLPSKLNKSSSSRSSISSTTATAAITTTATTTTKSKLNDFPSLGSNNQPKTNANANANANTNTTKPATTSVWGKKSTSTSVGPSSPWGKSNSSITSNSSNSSTTSSKSKIKSNEFKNLMNLVPKSSSSSSSTLKKKGKNLYH